jgi:stage II sporulation protein D
LTKQSDGSFTSETIDEIGDITDIVVNKRLLGGVIDELDMIGTKRTVRVISERNVRFVLANEADNVTLQNDVQSKVTSMLPSAFAVINTQKDDNGVVTSYEVIGGGYGHGIGLSQNGAKNMAEAGYDCEEIMQFFYEGIELIKIGREG